MEPRGMEEKKDNQEKRNEPMQRVKEFPETMSNRRERREKE